MTRPRGGNLSRGQSSGRSRGSRGQVIGRGQAVPSHGGDFVVSHDLTAEDINVDTTIQEPVDEEGIRSDIAIWTDELTSSVLEKYEEIYLHKDRRPNLSKNMWKIIVDHINGISTEGVFTEKQVKTKIDSVKKRYMNIKEKKSQSGTGTSEGVLWPHYDVCDRLWAVTPKTSGIPGGMDAGQSSTPIVVGITDEPSFVNPSEPSTEVPDLNVDMENDEPEELEETQVQGTEGAGTNTQADERRTETPPPTNPSTSHRVDDNVTGQRTSEKRKQPEVDQDTQYMANALSGFSALYSKNEQSRIEQMQKFEMFRIQAAAEATKATLESQERIAKMNIDAQERATRDKIEAEERMQRQRLELEMMMETRREEFQKQLMELKESLRRKQ